MSLYAGSRSGDVGKVKEVLKQGADPNWRNVFYVSCLLQVVTNNKIHFEEVNSNVGMTMMKHKSSANQ